MKLQRFVENIWYGKSQSLFLQALLTPFSYLYRTLAYIDRRRQQRQADSGRHLPMPLIVVGNLSVGGTGKTPVTLALVEYLASKGQKPAILSRGYGGQIKDFPHAVQYFDSATQVGDEPLLLQRRSSCPVVIDPDRYRGLQYIAAQCDATVVICDDGLQHLRLPRSVEIVVVDGTREFGNRKCLPAGPLREPLSRLESIDFVIINSQNEGQVKEGEWPPPAYRMKLQPTALVNLQTGQRHPLDVLAGEAVEAVAGIGNPARFFQTLKALGYAVRAREFPDHYQYQASDFGAESGRPIIMTEKDAVKCSELPEPLLGRMWYLEVSGILDTAFLESLWKRVQAGVTQKAPEINF